MNFKRQVVTAEHRAAIVREDLEEVAANSYEREKTLKLFTRTNVF